MKNNRVTFTPELIRAASLDAGNASMRHSCRKHWNEADYNTAVREYNRLMDVLEGVNTNHE